MKQIQSRLSRKRNVLNFTGEVTKRLLLFMPNHNYTQTKLVAPHIHTVFINVLLVFSKAYQKADSKVREHYVCPMTVSS